jgi:Family of unknown function (DUF5682)
VSEGVHCFGIRHHGPGSARSLTHALAALQPDCVLIEGPPDANELLPLAAHAQLEPPVALLVYVADSPRSAVFYPFAHFSPEWRAIRYALERQIPVRFIDLPQSARLTQDDAAAAEPHAAEPQDPLSPIAQAVGYDDVERWWDHFVESRAGDDIEVFRALHELMTAVRKDLEAPQTLVEQRREAYMRRSIREARAEGFARIAVVCGAYHTPALDPLPSAAADASILKGLPKIKTSAAWVPWTYERLSYHSGYGAGVESPVWYELLWDRRSALGAEWLGRAARLLREADLPISSAHVIEACRLADTLAALRERPLATLSEYRDAAVAVLSDGDPLVIGTIRRLWYFGARLGVVPAEFPAAPLARDLKAEQTRLRFAARADEKTHDFDLRETLDRERSRLLRRLRILGIDWGVPSREGPRSKGSFHEFWQVRWQPEFAVALIEASRDGHTLVQAATSRIVQAAAGEATLPQLVGKLEDVLLADLPQAVPVLVAAIQNRTAAATDVQQLLDALPPLVAVSRYGDVRGTDTAQVTQILTGLLPRIFIGVPPAAAGIDEDASRGLWQRLKAAHQALQTLDDAGYWSEWLETLQRLDDSVAAHALIRGYACRALYDASRMSPEKLERTLGFTLSTGGVPSEAAMWIEGLLSGSGSVLVHDDRLRGAIDTWLRGIAEEQFICALPLLRRSFAEFSPSERRLIGERLRPGGAPPKAVASAEDFDEVSARAILPVLELIWGTGSKA